MLDKILKTSIDVTVATNTGTTTTFDFEIKNTNSEKLWDFENFDIVVTYDSGSPATTYTETLSYDDACPPVAGEWCINNWDTDVLDPGILNDGETITVDAEVNNALKNNSDLIIIVSTDLGVIDSVTKTVN